jgi:hypothetical protein
MDAVKDRLEAISALAGRVHGAARLAQLTERGAQAQASTAAFVLPLGLRGGSADAVTGMFRQALDRLVGVVLMVRNVGDATGAAAQAELEPLIEAVIGAIAGWAPDEAIGVYKLARGELVSIAAGTVTYQLDFALDDQLRIAR